MKIARVNEMNVDEQRPAMRLRELLTEVKMQRLEFGSERKERADKLAREEPLEIRVNGQSVAVTMRTPGHDEELAAGFLLTEGLIKKSEDIAQMFHCRPVAKGAGEVQSRSRRREETDDSGDGARGNPPPHVGGYSGQRGAAGENVLNVSLEPSVKLDLSRLTRHVFASSSCGVCGKASIESVRQQFPPMESGFRVGQETLVSLPEKMRAAQAAFDETGGLHAAAIFDANGELLVLREDVGRHNALDKVLGRGLLDGLQPFERHVLLVSGRASFEIMQKALAGRLPIICAISAPSSLAVEFARDSGQTLVGFLRGEGMNVYSHPEHITE